MTNQRWSSEHERDWRGASDWRARDRRSADERQFYEGHNPAGPAQSYGGREERSWSAGDRTDRNYGDQGPRNYGYDQTNRYYGAEWSDRDSYDARRADFGADYRRGAYGEYGRDISRAYGRDTGFGDPNPYVQSATDGEAQGTHRGRGPADYKRSDDRIREDVNDRLTDDAHIDASGIQVAVKDGEVTLNGTVDSRFAKRHAEDLADRVSGARHVQNNLRVSEGGTTRSDTAPTPTTARGSSTLS